MPAELVLDLPGRHRLRLAAPHILEADTPSLDPVPQELTAIIEARLCAAGVSLPAQ